VIREIRRVITFLQGMLETELLERNHMLVISVAHQYWVVDGFVFGCGNMKTLLVDLNM